MRDPERIDSILKLLEEAWKKNPDLRLTQLIMNALGFAGDPYYVEDYAIDKALKQYIKQV